MSSNRDIERDLYRIASDLTPQSKTILRPGSEAAKVLFFLQGQPEGKATSPEIARGTGVKYLLGGVRGIGPIHRLLDAGLIIRVKRGIYQITPAGRTEYEVLNGAPTPEGMHYVYNKAKRDELGLTVALRSGRICVIPEDVVHQIRDYLATMSPTLTTDTNILDFEDAHLERKWTVTFHKGKLHLTPKSAPFTDEFTVSREWFKDRALKPEKAPSDEEFFQSGEE